MDHDVKRDISAMSISPESRATAENVLPQLIPIFLSRFEEIRMKKVQRVYEDSIQERSLIQSMACICLAGASVKRNFLPAIWNYPTS